MKAAEDLGVGATVAEFRVECLLGRGGMSTVYLARDLLLDRRVALKVLAASLAADEGFGERFLRESRVAASIDHPHIVPIYRAGDSDGVLFIAMRYVAGRDLKQRMRDGRMELGQTAAILAQVADALDAAHARGLVHRDVKPSNILLDPGTGPDGADHAYLADFGLTTRPADPTGPDGGPLEGTVDYMAPEQIAGGVVDGRSDVYSLGCVLFECLVGEPPFRRDTAVQVVFAHLDADPPAIGGRRAGLPVALDAVLARALAKDPAHRFPSCRELTGAVLALVVDETGRRLADLSGRAAAGRQDLREVERDLAGRVIELQAARDRVRSGSDDPAVAPAAHPGVCPFKGLASYRAVDADGFFGRERLTAELVARLAGTSFLGIVGPSGSGKSSVLHAGLIPALAAGVLQDSARWRPVLIRPGDRPLDELQRILESAADGPPLLVVDQLEELFTANRSAAERAAFVDLLVWGSAVVLVALRADFYGHVAAFPALADRLGTNHVLVGPMQPSELRRVVEGPAGRAGLRVEPDLVDRLVDDVQGAPGALPLLSTALVELWQGRQDDTLSLASYLAGGGVRGAIARLAETTYARVPQQHRPVVRAIMLRLVGPGDVDAAIRRRAPLAELEPHRREVAGVLSTLVDGRLVTVSQDSVELAHEALLREWPRLRGWIEQDAQGRRLRRQVTDAATEWDTAGRDPSVLYRGARLADALDWCTDHPTELNTLERAFITTSRDAAQQEDRRVRRSNRRLRGLLTAVAVLLVAALVGGTLAAIQRGNAQEAETAQFAQRLAAQAPVEEDLDLALLLARQAVAIQDTPQTRGSLLGVLSRAPAAVAIMNGDDDAYLQSVALSPDGSTLAVLDFYNKILFFDTRTYQPIGEPLTENTWLDSLAYSPDGRVLAYGGAGDSGAGYLRLIDAHTREPLAHGSVGGRPTNMAFTPDGTRLVVVDASTRAPVISVRDAATLKRVGPTIELVGFRPCDITTSCWATHFALTADGRALLTASDAGELVWWDLDSGRRTRTLPIEAGQGPLDLSPDGRLAAVGTAEGIQLIELSTGAVRTAAGSFTRTPHWVRFSPDGSTVMSANADGTVTLWDTATASVRETLHGHSGLALQSAFSPDGSTLYTVSGDGTAIAWDLAGTRSIGRAFALADGDGSGPFTQTYAPLHPGRFSPDGTVVAVGLSGHGVGLWNAADLRAVGGTPLETRGEVKALAFSPDGQTLTIMTDSGEVTIWDLPSRSLRTGPIHTWPSLFLPALAVAPDGSTLLTTGSAGGLQLWDADTGADRGNFAAGSNVSDLSLSADGTRAAFAQFNGAEVWDLARREPVATVPGDAQADEFSVALSPDGQTLAVGGYGRFVRVWDVESRKLLHELDQGGARPLSLEFSPDGRSLATAGTLWDVATGTRIGPDLATGYQTSMMDLSPDGHRLLLTSPDGKVAIWDVDPNAWALRACALANRTLTNEEWDRFLPGRPYDPACAR